MRTPYYKLSDADLCDWARSLSTTLSADPGAFDVPIDRAAAVADDVAAYAEAFRLASDPLTRTPVAIARKNDCRARLLRSLGVVAAIVESNGDNDEQRARLGLPVRRTRQRWAAPTEAPSVFLGERDGTAVTIRIQPRSGNARALPAQTSGAMVYGFAGPNPPTTLEAWTFFGVATTRKMTVRFPHALPAGTPVSITARWFNPTGEGPPAEPIHTVLAGGLIRPAA